MSDTASKTAATLRSPTGAATETSRGSEQTRRDAVVGGVTALVSTRRAVGASSEPVVSGAGTAIIADDGSTGTEIVSSDEPLSADWHDPLDGTPWKTVAPLGEGAGGQVVLATSRSLHHRVVVKLLHASVEGEDARDRFTREAALLARIRHRNVVLLHSFEISPAGRPFIVMEHLEGRTLQEHLFAAGGGPLPLDEALELVAQACTGLQALHSAGVVHRDVKPSNLFVERTGTVKVLDLGLSKVMDLAASVAGMAARTESGMIMGTARYLAPEQARSARHVEERTDQYAIGCILYRCLAGRGPFDDARGWEEVVAAHLLREPEPPSRHLRAPLPAGLDELVLRCLAKHPEQRFPSAAALAEALREAQRAIRTSDDFGPGFVTQPMAPATVMYEPELAGGPSHPIALPPSSTMVARASRGVSWGTFWVFLGLAIVIGGAVGGIIVALGVR